MKRLITFLLLFAALKVAGQTTGYLRYDTVRIMRQNGTCELYIINSTKDSLGLLTNVGGGLTRFIKSRSSGDSLFVGLDTIVMSGTDKLDSLHIYTAADPDPDTLYSYKNGDSTLVGYIPKGSAANANVGSGYRILKPASQEIKTLFSDNTGTWDSTSNTDGLTYKVDTSVIATQHDLTQSIPSWNQTLTVNDTTHGDINFDTLVTVPSPGSFQKYWMRFQPLAKGEGSPPFLWTQNAQHYAGVGQADNTMAWGWNINPGGGAEIANQPGIGFSLEQRYIPAVGDTNTEAHLFYITTLGQQKRLFSYTIKEYLNSYDFYHTTSNFYIKTPTTDSVWYSMIPRQQVWYARGASGSASYSFFGDVSAVTIQRSGGALIGTEFKLVGFNTARFPGSTILENPTIKSAQLTFRGNSTDIGTIIFDSTKTIINALTDVPLRLNANNQTSAEIQSGKINLLKPTTIGTNTTPAAQLDVRDNATTYTRVLYVEQTATSGNRFGGIITAVGSGASTNTGLNLTANNGTTNRALRIDGPAAGANNHAIYSEATAQSYFAGNLGLGVTSPASLIHGIKTTEQLRLGYDASNYLSTTINSTGSATLNLVGTTPEFTFSDAVNVPDEVYGAGWDGNTEVPTKNAIYDKIETLGGITSINSQTQSAQTISVGNGMQVVSGGGTHTISIQPTFISRGTYTPTLTDISNLDGSSASANSSRYTQIDSMVTVYGKITVDPTTTATNTVIDVSLPIAASGLTDLLLSGVGVVSESGAPHISVNISGNTTVARLSFYANGTSSTGLSYTFSYKRD